MEVGDSTLNNHGPWDAGPFHPFGGTELRETQRQAFGPRCACLKLCALGLCSSSKWRWCAGGKGDGNVEGDGEEGRSLCVHCQSDTLWGSTLCSVPSFMY